ncbi:MAG: HAD-IC family P-type ATPase [Vicinamibacterales bacterium]
MTRDAVLATLAAIAIAMHLWLRLTLGETGASAGIGPRDWPLIAALVVGGVPVVWDLARRLLRREFSSDLLAGLSILTAVLLGEYLAGTLVVLMLTGGQALEHYAVRSASSALAALARRMPSRAHRREGGVTVDVDLDALRPGDLVVVFPHEICPVDGTVVEGRSTMDESYLTGEPYVLSKVAGSAVLSGAVNGIGALTIRAEKRAVESRFAKIMQVMRESEQRRPRLRRLGDQLGAVYTPVAVALALAAWAASGDPVRFLAVLVVATPCPLLIAIPVAIIGAVSLAARRGIVIKDPAVLEKVDLCRTAIFDKTGRSPTASPGSPTSRRRRDSAERPSWPFWPAWSVTPGTPSPRP